MNTSDQNESGRTKKKSPYVKLFSKEIVNEASAKVTFDGILDYYDIVFRDIEVDQGKEGALTVKNKLVRGIMTGRLQTHTHDDPKYGFQIILNLRTGDSITFNEYNHAALEAFNLAKGVKSIALMGALCDEGPDRLKLLKGPDLKTLEFISVLFSL